MNHAFRLSLVPVLLVLAGIWAARAAPPPIAAPSGSQDREQGEPTLLGGLERSNFLLGDMAGLRSFLAQYGVSLAVQETSEVFGNLTGGARRGAAYDGLTQAILQLDTQRAFGWHGGLFNVSALQIHGRNLSADNLLSLQTASGIEADRATRLWELWYDQKFLAEDRLDIRVGQQSLDQEFIVVQNGAYFVNTMFGWPLVPSVDLPGGGPAYPLSALGLRARWRPVNAVTILAGVFNGAPASPTSGDPQAVNGGGTQFPTGDHQLYFAELQYAYPALGGLEMPGEGPPLGRTYKIGVWYDSELFADQRLDTAGIPLASPTSNGVARRHRGDYSIYATADRMVWRQESDPNRSVSVFGRAMGTPRADRNLVDVSLNAGAVLHEPITNYPDDVVGLGMGFAHVSDRVAEADADAAAFGRIADPTALFPIRRTETYVEATYQHQVFPWWQVQPDVQYVFNPGGGIADPTRPNRRVGDELVVGLRTNILF